MSPEFIPIAKFSKMYRLGWRMLDGYPLNPGDYAVLMAPPAERSSTRKAGADHRVDKFLKLLGTIREGA
jgi:hypothetical protein